VKFHNGKEMTSDDVIASLARWGKQSVYGKTLFSQVAEWKALDKYTVEMKLKEKSSIVLISLAVPNNFGAIYPKEIAEKFAPEVKVDRSGSAPGPFKLAEWKPDQYIRMVRFDDYKPRNEKPNGYGGGKTAYLDEVASSPVPEVATRVAQVETGELDFRRRPESRRVRPAEEEPEPPPDRVQAVLLAGRRPEQEEGLMTNAKLPPGVAGRDRHRADHEERGRRPHRVLPDGLEPHPAEIPAWHTKLSGCRGTSTTRTRSSGSSPRRATRKEPIRFMTTQEYKWMYDFALLTKQQLEDVGFVIDLQVVDWATLVKRRNNSKEYDAFTTGIGAFYDPTHVAFLTAGWPGWTTDEDILKLQAELARETDVKKRQALWEQQTRQFFEKVPVIRYGDLFGLRAIRNTTKGFNEKTERIRFYNVWVEK
jgi:peptide/nickel transport system substrate-binding protein